MSTSSATMPEHAGLDRLIGRDGELHVFDAVLARCAECHPALVEVVGDPGQGKTRLLQELADRARVAGAPVLAVGAGPRRGYTAERALRELTGPDGRYRPGTPARRGVEVLLLDDLHAAGPATLDLLARLLQTAPDGLLVAAAYRPRQVSPDAVAALAAGTGVRRHLVQLDGLAPEDVGALVDLPGGRLAGWLHRLTGGVPRYVRAYRPAVAKGALAMLRGLPDELPSDVTAAVQVELAGLPEDQRTLLHSVSVCPDGFDVSLSATLGGLDPAVAGELLDALVAGDLLRVDRREDRTLRFRNEVERAVVYRSMRPGRRHRLHHHAAAFLREHGAPVVRYAEHLSRSAHPGDTAAVDALVEAAESALACRIDAIRWFTTARRLLPDAHTVAPTRVRLSLGLADGLVGTGQLHEARTLLQDLVGTAEPAADERIRALVAQARVERLLGRPLDAYALVQGAVADAPVSARLDLAMEAALAGALSGQPAAVGYARQAVQAAAELGDPVSRCAADTVEAFVRAYADPDATMDAILARAATTVDALPDAVLGRRPDLLGVLAWTELLRERDRFALRHFDRALEVCCHVGRIPLTPWLLTGRSTVALRLGHLDRARADALDAEVSAQAMGVDPLVGLARTYRAIALAWHSGPAAARQLAETALLDATMRRRNWYDEASQRLAARLRFEAGDRADSLPALLRACGGDELAWVEASDRACWASSLAEMARRGERPDEAAMWLALAHRYADRTRLLGQRAKVHLTQARLASDAGDPHRAAEYAAAAADAFADLGWRLDEGAARLVQARALCDARLWAAAEAELSEARRLADLTGSPPLRKAVAVEQRRAGGCAGRSPAAGPRTGRQLAGWELALTRREWDIARLVAAGISNAEAAEHLYVTVKTVEAHLTRIFRKTGVSSRAGLAALLANHY
jgi:DNA-binding CsgD family transcriptional regulator